MQREQQHFPSSTAKSRMGMRDDTPHRVPAWRSCGRFPSTGKLNNLIQTEEDLVVDNFYREINRVKVSFVGFVQIC